jgi:hypothetical protein
VCTVSLPYPPPSPPSLDVRPHRRSRHIAVFHRQPSHVPPPAPPSGRRTYPLVRWPAFLYRDSGQDYVFLHSMALGANSSGGSYLRPAVERIYSERLRKERVDSLRCRHKVTQSLDRNCRQAIHRQSIKRLARFLLSEVISVGVLASRNQKPDELNDFFLR